MQVPWWIWLTSTAAPHRASRPGELHDDEAGGAFMPLFWKRAKRAQGTPDQSVPRGPVKDIALELGMTVAAVERAIRRIQVEQDRTGDSHTAEHGKPCE